MYKIICSIFFFFKESFYVTQYNFIISQILGDIGIHMDNNKVYDNNTVSISSTFAVHEKSKILSACESAMCIHHVQQYLFVSILNK